MSTDEVCDLLSSYEVMTLQLGNVARISRDAVIFREGTPVALRATFVPRRRLFHTFESCTVYFGQDGVIVAYYCEWPD